MDWTGFQLPSRPNHSRIPKFPSKPFSSSRLAFPSFFSPIFQLESFQIKMGTRRFWDSSGSLKMIIFPYGIRGGNVGSGVFPWISNPASMSPFPWSFSQIFPSSDFPGLFPKPDFLQAGVGISSPPQKKSSKEKSGNLGMWELGFSLRSHSCLRNSQNPGI